MYRKCMNPFIVTIYYKPGRWGGGTQGRGWLRHCVARRKVAVSIPDCVSGILHWHDPSGRTMALESTQPLTELTNMDIPWGYRWPLCRADNLTTFMCWFSWNVGDSTYWNPQVLSRAVMGFALFLYINYKPSVPGSNNNLNFKLYSRYK
jgi:hypothetical protein